ncbi:uncharacterized protein LOC126968624 [Leptidea sinapis]|uniref:uncharacterized protein LOC126968624 n=1 Tax=Leptidea sinapis TaxID=189913 RepID=UPI0021C2F08F|nr:uncharacterized protein LOC126968624 [Leptidea sinapis]
MEVSLVSTMGERGREATCAALHGGLLVLGFSGGGVGAWRWRGGRGWSPAGEARRAHRYGTTAVSLAPAGALLASAGVARVWDARAGRPLGPRAALAAPQPAAARVVRWAAAGERLAVGYDDGALRVWLTRSATVAALLLAHEDAVRALCLLADEALLLTACAGGVLKVFDFLEVCDAAAEGGGRPRPLFWEDGVHELGVVCAADDGGGVAATGGHDGRLRLWSVTERRVLPGRALCGHSGAVTDLQFSAELLASASMDRTARIWSPARAACLKVLHGHTGYLTCLAISSQEPFFLVTGSNDNTVRTWSSGGVSVPDEMDAACPVLSHFALGDLEGIGPVVEESVAAAEVATADGEARLVWSADGHSGPVNWLAVSERHLATCGSDGAVVLYDRCTERGESPVRRWRTVAHVYPALSVELARGQLLVSAGLDGRVVLHDPELLVSAGLDGRVVLHDPESSAELMSVCGDAGAGVRCARVSPTTPDRLLLASDTGPVTAWNLLEDSAAPAQSFCVLEGGATCCAWSRDASLVAAGGGSGDLRLFDARSEAATTFDECPPALWQLSEAHDLGVLSCDFSSVLGFISSEEECRNYLLATGGRDDLIKLWTVFITSEEQGLKARVSLAQSVRAHCGGVHSVQWWRPPTAASSLHDTSLTTASLEMLASSGDDHWVYGMRPLATGVPGAGGARCAVLMSPRHVAVGALDGSLHVWQLPHEPHPPTTRLHPLPRYWRCDDVIQWLSEYVIHHPGSQVDAAEAERMTQAARRLALTGAALLELPVERTLRDLLTSVDESPDCENSLVEEHTECDTLGEENRLVEGEMVPEPTAGCSEVLGTGSELHKRLRDELLWLRWPATPAPQQVEHSLLCGLTHRPLRDPVRLADGFTYERRALYEHLLAQDLRHESAVSPMTRRQLVSDVVSPNHRVRDLLRNAWGYRGSSA